MTTFLLEIITPDRIAFSEAVEMVSVPSVTGTLGILPGHQPLFTKLIAGELEIKQKGSQTLFSLGGGFMEVTGEKVSIVVTRAVGAEELDEQKILKAKEEAEEALKNPPSPEQAIATQAMLRSILVDLKVVRRHRPKPMP